MATRPDRYPFETLLEQFEAIVHGAQETIVAKIEAAVRSGDLATASRRQLQLAAVDRTLTHLALTANPLASRIVHDAWHQGAARAQQQVYALPVDAPELPGAFAGVSREAVEVMQRSLIQRLDSAQQTIGRRVEDVFAREQRRATLRSILGADGSPHAASQHLQERLMAKSVNEGRTGFVDSAGRRWSLESYANMATRTVTREAVVQGAVARMASHGIAVARVSTHPGACEICIPFQGTLVSLDGQTTSYKGEAVSDTGELPPYHPNCAHSLMPVSATIDSLREELELEPEGVNA